ncbi:MAG: MmcQ/YjbR family DNA-binding protein [Ignavibacteria bacterium]
MNLEFFRNIVLNLPEVEECQPFGDDVLVYKTRKKIFLMMNFNYPLELTVKCQPEVSLKLRERYDSITPAYHMNKKHWITIASDGSVPLEQIIFLIKNSYKLVRIKNDCSHRYG